MSRYSPSKIYYRDVLGFEIFEAYCKAKWDFSRIRAYQLIEAVEVWENLLTVVNTDHTNEFQTRPLVKIRDPEKQKEVWQKAVEIVPEGNKKAARRTALWFI